MSGANVQLRVCLVHAQAACVKRFVCIHAIKADRIQAFHGLAVLDNPEYLLFAVIVEIVLSEHHKQLIFSGEETTELRQFHSHVPALYKGLARSELLDHQLSGSPLHAVEAAVVPPVQVGIHDVAPVVSVILSMLIAGSLRAAAACRLQRRRLKVCKSRERHICAVRESRLLQNRHGLGDGHAGHLGPLKSLMSDHLKSF